MKSLHLLSIMAITLLVSCSGASSSTLSQSSSAYSSSESKSSSSTESSLSSSSGSSSSSSSSVSPHLTIKLRNAEIKEGADFFGGCAPSIVYTSGTGKETDVTSKPSTALSLVVTSVDGLNTYEAGDLLPVGEYKAKAIYKSQSDTVSFSVISSSSIAGTEGKEYTTTTFTGDTFADHQNPYGITTLGKAALPSTDEQKVIVIPVTFTGVDGFSDDELTLINDAYFSSTMSSDGGWESLSSYYTKSSYEKLTIGGIVTPQYTYPMDTTTFEKTSSVDALVNAAIAFLESSEGINLNPLDYDSNKDGYIDGIEIIYKTDQKSLQEGGSSLWWNYSSHIYEKTGDTSSLTSPAPYRYFFSLYSSLDNGYFKSTSTGKNYPDAHTIVHETGHMMGATDYYSYSYDEGPSGGAIMMDKNIGDHDPYTKMGLGWVSPKVIDTNSSSDSFTITLDSFSDTGDMILVPSGIWNGTPYDEYTVIALYTPTGVNESDSKGYAEWPVYNTNGDITSYLGTYTATGIEAFHVDSRVASAYLDSDNNATGWTYTDKVYDEDRNTLGDKTISQSFIPASNTRAYALDVASSDLTGKEVYDDENRILSALVPSGNDTFGNSNFYSLLGQNSTLFGDKNVGGECGENSFSIYKMRDLFKKNSLAFDNGETPLYDWDVTNITPASEGISASATIRFTKLG